MIFMLTMSFSLKNAFTSVTMQIMLPAINYPTQTRL